MEKPNLAIFSIYPNVLSYSCDPSSERAVGSLLSSNIGSENESACSVRVESTSNDAGELSVAMISDNCTVSYTFCSTSATEAFSKL